MSILPFLYPLFCVALLIWFAVTLPKADLRD